MIKIHSQVDLITNSSTVIYTSASGDTIDKAKQLINAVLATAGNDLVTVNADSLYNFALEWCENTLEMAYEELLENPQQYGISEEITEDEDDSRLMDIAVEKLDSGWVPYDDYGRTNEQYLVITDKDGNVVKDFNAFLNSLTHEANYNG